MKDHADSAPFWKRLLWLAVIWLASVLLLGVFAYFMRMVMNAVGLSTP